MSDLQLSLLAIGALVVVGVYVFNWWQERRLRRRLEEAFGAERDDVLLGVPATQAPAQRLEPQLQSAPAEQSDPEPEPIAAPPSVETSEPAQAPPVPPVPWFDEMLDYVAELHASEPIAESVLAELLAKTAETGRPWLAAGYDEASGRWEELSQPEPGRYTRAFVAVQIVTRNGAVTAPQLATLCEAVRACGSSAGAEVHCPDAQAALDRAHELDAFCADVDVAIGLNIVAPADAPFSGSRIRSNVEGAGFVLAPDGVFHFRDGAGRTLYTLDNHEQVAFAPDRMKSFSSKGLTILLDVPRVPEPQQVLAAMAKTAQGLAGALGGRLVDDNRAALSAGGIARIKQQLEDIARKMTARGVPPGSERALRLFS